MAWTITDDLDEYLAEAGSFMLSRPVQHTIQLTAVETVRESGISAFGDQPPLFGWWRSPGGEVTAAVLQTPPFPVLLTPLPEGAARELAEALAARGRELPGVNAEETDARSFGAAWTSITGGSAREFMRSRLFSLGRLDPPRPGPEGAARVASAADRDLLVSWFTAALAEMGDIAHRSAAGFVDDRLSHRGVTLWEAGGSAVSMAGVTRPLAGTVRLGPVYTPRELRRRGYAGAVTAAVSQAALDAGVRNVLLFTDLANPTSNALYQRLGYRPVADRLVLSFQA